jgi:hypothetical protein
VTADPGLPHTPSRGERIKRTRALHPSFTTQQYELAPHISPHNPITTIPLHQPSNPRQSLGHQATAHTMLHANEAQVDAFHTGSNLPYYEWKVTVPNPRFKIKRGISLSVPTMSARSRLASKATSVCKALMHFWWTSRSVAGLRGRK